ncbi:hypothetical protein [Kitasatospora sp. McL0602]|uniref:hypothetical protein n=1 Tax=Kitasatospora sp. McL0602 TaxID=3439530 RepID=UPI003F8C9023
MSAPLNRPTTTATLTSKIMRYEVVAAAGSHVLRDTVLGEFCTLPDPSGTPVLLAFPDAYHARLWLMMADTRRARAASEVRIRAAKRWKPTAVQAGLLLFDLYAPQDGAG